MTHLPSSKECTNLMVITCRMTGNLILAPLRELTTEAVANEFLWVFYRHHGPPQWIVSDRGTQWVNGFWERVCELIRIERKLSTAYHPQTDGATERANQEVQAYLRAYIVYTQTDWADRLPAAQLALNNRGGIRGPSPFFITHGYNIEPVQLCLEDT